MTVRLIWLQRAGLTVLFVLLVLLARESAVRSIDFPVYHRAARQVIAGHYEFYPVEAYGGTPGPSQGFRYAPAIAFLFLPFGWLPLELAALAFFALKLAALWYVGATVARHVGLSESRRQVFLIAFLIVGGYIAEELRFGNVHLFYHATSREAPPVLMVSRSASYSANKEAEIRLRKRNSPCNLRTCA